MSSPLPLGDLEAMDRLAREATPGPWKRLEPDENYDQHADIATKVVAKHGAFVLQWRVLAEVNPRYPNAANDAAFIAFCTPERVAQLVAAARDSARELNETALLLQKVTAALNNALDDEAQALFHYQAGYTAGYSHGRRHAPQRCEESAKAFIAPRATRASRPTEETDG